MDLLPGKSGQRPFDQFGLQSKDPSTVGRPFAQTPDLGRRNSKRCITQNKSDIMTVSVAPCHDKKLETFRPESVVEEVPVGAEGAGPKSLDVVLTTSEIVDLLLHEPDVPLATICYSGDVLMAQVNQGQHAQPGYFENFSVTGYEPSAHPIFMPSQFASLNSSNNFLGQLFLRRVLARSGRLPQESAFKESLRRNKKGFVEVTLEDEGSQTKLFGARVYGFKNIQNMIRNLKTSGSDKIYDYVEVLACPGGCYSGGGQLKEKDTNPAGTEKAFDSLHRVRTENEKPQVVESSKMVDESEEVPTLHTQGHVPTFRRYFFENAAACELANTILANKCRWMKREDVEYKIKSLQTDNPLAMKW